jgi:hypothetical protein
MPIRDKKEGFTPAPYTVICHALLTKENGNHDDYVGKYMTHRVGVAHSVKECRELIAADLVAMRDTLGGVLPGVSTKGRSYEIFHAEWTSVPLNQN